MSTPNTSSGTGKKSEEHIKEWDPLVAPAPLTVTVKKKRSSGGSPTARTLAVIRKNGNLAQVVEKWNAWAKIRQDLFGCIDIVVCDKVRRKIIGVQATSGSNHSARVKKSMAEPRLKDWLLCGAEFEVWSWKKGGERGKVKRWGYRKERIYLENGQMLVEVLDSSSL